jgi:tRNA threonylcarbamoyladenosine biosynthesis protein TsaB
MKILAIETSTILGGVAIMDNLSGLFAEVRFNAKSTHSERLMTEIDYVLRQAGLKISDIDVFAVAIGPGSFTGLRIGLSTVKGFSYATGKPIVSVPTLEALAWNFPYCRYPVCTMLDARKKEVYTALFTWDKKGFIRSIEEMSIKVDKFLKKINETFIARPPLIPPVKGGKVPSPPPWRTVEGSPCRVEKLTQRGKGEAGFFDRKVVFTGEGALLYRNTIVEVMGEKAIFATPEKMIPSAANVASIGIRKAARGEFSQPVSLLPFYIRRSEAEMKGND